MTKKGMENKTIQVYEDGKVRRIFLNRPHVHNAFNDTLIEELTQTLEKAAKDENVRVIVIGARGKSFCAGADLNWMRKMKDYSYEENVADSDKLADLMYTLFTIPKPTIARVQGAAIGGGTGLAASCDIVVASRKAKFSLSEVKLGLVPAVISPYVIRRIGPARAGEYFLTGERLTGEKALWAGLVNELVEESELDAAIDKRIEQLSTSGPEALRMGKELVRNVPGMTFDEVKRYTSDMIAKLRVSREGQEGMNAFFEKRKPYWCAD